MTKNNYNKIAKHFTYNNIGLVDSTIFESGAKVAYTYSMSGEKLRIRHYAAPETMVSTQPSGNEFVPVLPGGSLEDILRLFKFVADYTDVEWEMNEYATAQGNKYLIMTNHKPDGVTMYKGLYKKIDLKTSIHSHPGDERFAKASGYEINSVQNGRLYRWGSTDQSVVNDIYVSFFNVKRKYPDAYPRFFIYHPQSKKRIQYNPYDPKKTVTRVSSPNDLIK